MSEEMKKVAITIVSFSTQNPDRQAELRRGVAELCGPGAELLFPADEQAAIRMVPAARVMLSWKFTPAMLAAAPRLEWLHLSGAGAEHVLTAEVQSSRLLVTNSRGIHGAYMAEWTLAALLYLSQRFGEIEQWRRDRVWKPHKDQVQRTRFLLRGRTALILGYGEVGRAISALLRATGVICEAVVSTPRSDEIPLHALADLPALLPRFDLLIVALPLTPRTRGLIDGNMLAHLKPNAILVNVARGHLIHEPDLIDALQSGRLAYAALDVFATEPLPPESPLFNLPNAFLAPHVSGNFPSYSHDVIALFLDNLRAYLAGEPLRFVVDKQRGY